jgi:hypothetical protein
MIVNTWFIGSFASLLGVAFVLERIYAKRQSRLGRLICKYNDHKAAHRVFRREIWQGQTEIQLLDSQGEPVRKSRLLATPWREEWIYSPRGFGGDLLQVTLENGLVTAWGSATTIPVKEGTYKGVDFSTGDSYKIP